MATLRIIHKTWSTFWAICSILLVVLASCMIILFGGLQLNSVKQRLMQEAETTFNTRFQGHISINSLNGILPFQFLVQDVILYEDSTQSHILFEADTIYASVNPWKLFQNTVQVEAIRVQNPKVTINLSEPDAISNAFAPARIDTGLVQVSEAGNEERELEFLIPSVIIENGLVSLEGVRSVTGLDSLDDNIVLSNIELSSFIEYNRRQRFIDLNNLAFNTSQDEIKQMVVSGQVFNDDQFFEVNALQIRVDRSLARINAEADGVNLLSGELKDQFLASIFDLDIGEFQVQPDDWAFIVPELKEFSDPVRLTLHALGTRDSIAVEDLGISVGNTGLELFGYVYNPLNDNTLGYSSNFKVTDIDSLSLSRLPVHIPSHITSIISRSELTGTANGTLQEHEVRMDIQSLVGHFLAEGTIHARDGSSRYYGQFDVQQLNLDSFFPSHTVESRIGVSGGFDVYMLNRKLVEGRVTISSDSSTVNHLQVKNLTWTAHLEEETITTEVIGELQDGNYEASGTFDFSDRDSPLVAVNGTGRSVNLASILPSSAYPQTNLEAEFNLNVSGGTLDDIEGEFSLDIPFSLIEGDTLPPHQLYLDVLRAAGEERTIRLTSTVLDATVSGMFVPTEIWAMAPYWSTFLEQQIRHELLFESDSVMSYPDIPFATNQNIELQGRIKNLDILNRYITSLPSLRSRAIISANMNVDEENLLATLDFYDPEFRYGTIELDSVRFQTTGNARYGEPLTSFTNYQIQAEAVKASTSVLSMNQLDLYATLDQDLVTVTASADQIGENTFFGISSSGIVNERELLLKVDELSLGNQEYFWEQRGDPALRYRGGRKLFIDQFAFSNDDQIIEINGAFSPDLQDSVRYNIQNVNIRRISDLIEGRVDFGGRLNGQFVTRSLRQVPTIQGTVGIDSLTLDDELFGDISLSSKLNREEQQFDTRLMISTDPEKYPEYYEGNEREGQHVIISGFVKAPVNGVFPETDTLFYFDSDFESLDLWALLYATPKVFTATEGGAEGVGKVWGNMDDFDVEANLMLGNNEAVFLRPKFLNTDYYGQGTIRFTKDRGFIFDEVYLIDPSGGMATLSGTYDFNNFSRIHNMNLTVNMDEFQFLNSNFDPVLPFFGEAYGTSQIRIEGTNLRPSIRSEGPIIIGDYSEIGVPLLEETEFQEDNTFIRFVSSFEEESEERTNLEKTPQELAFEASQLSFLERFTLDLQFEAPTSMDVQLIFDPVTGDVIDVNGLGRIRVILENEELSMFGRFDVAGGNYQFVSGDILSRRLSIEPGGSISWEGPPDNARLDVDAVYRARPDINKLSVTTAQLEDAQQQRVPVELVVSIGGFLTSIENEFFFRLPNTIDLQQNNAVTSQINALNRNEDEKLIQATSLLVLNDFIPVGGPQNSNFTESVSGTGAVLNPLLSSQIISPLLSNQINALLNSDVTSLDVDFNLNTYNQVDLGVALRLYNDKIVLRREGQITGNQSNIGDIGATYRINQILALTAFHRQDPTFSDFNNSDQAQQSQDINGVGVEAKVVFNTWKGFLNRLMRPFKRMFGRSQRKEESVTNIQSATTDNGTSQ
ncbi:MAG: AsmA family protein [Bacteroidota bacterium]